MRSDGRGGNCMFRVDCFWRIEVESEAWTSTRERGPGNELWRVWRWNGESEDDYAFMDLFLGFLLLDQAFLILELELLQTVEEF